MNMFEDFIGTFENSIPIEMCNEIAEWFDYCSDKNFTEGNIGTAEETKWRGKRERADETIIIPTFVSSKSFPEELSNAFWGVLNNCFHEYYEKYSLGHLNLCCYVFKLHKVKEGEGYHLWHSETESIRHSSRVLAWMTYLKVPEEGGETEFLYQSKRIKPVVGTTLIWPAYFTHLHRGNPPLKGEKYYITGWFEMENT